MKRAAVLVMVLTILLSGCGAIPAEAAETQKLCTVGTALKYVAEQLGLEPAGSGYAGYRAALENVELLTAEEFQKTRKNITRAELSLLASHVMDYLGEPEDTIQTDRIRKYGRVSDMADVPEELRHAVARIYGAGILVGNSDGLYTQSRTFHPDGAVTLTGLKSTIQRAMGKKDRSPMSPDGQLIRTTGLPFNACEYDYVLASFPNSFYQLKFGYELSYFNHLPVSPKDYAAPADVRNRNAGAMIEEWKYEWAELVKKNYELKLNFDYRTAEEERWIRELAATYNGRFDRERNAEQTKRIADWVKWAKKNKVVIESEIVSVEPSTFHYSSGLNVCCYVRFRIKSCTDFEKNKDKVVFTGSGNCQMGDVKLGEWYGDIIANGVCWYTLTPTGDTAGIQSDDAFCPFGERKYTMFKKTGLMQPVKLSESTYGFGYIR